MASLLSSADLCVGLASLLTQIRLIVVEARERDVREHATAL
jgi:hypothetical protein